MKHRERSLALALCYYQAHLSPADPGKVGASHQKLNIILLKHSYFYLSCLMLDLVLNGYNHKMLWVKSCIVLHFYAGCILSNKQTPRGITRSPRPAPHGKSQTRQASHPMPLPEPGNAHVRLQPLWLARQSARLAPPPKTSLTEVTAFLSSTQECLWGEPHF